MRSAPVPVTGLALNFSPMPRRAPPPFGSVGGALWAIVSPLDRILLMGRPSVAGYCPGADRVKNGVLVPPPAPNVGVPPRSVRRSQPIEWRGWSLRVDPHRFADAGTVVDM